VGSQITLASGALLTLNANGTFSYDPNGQFETLAAGASDTDSFTYQLSDGGTLSQPGVFAGSLELSSLNGSTGFVINGIDAGDFSSWSISSAGDFNGDGVDDILIGAWQGDPNGTNSGESYVVFGSSGGFAASLDLSSLNGSTGFVLNGVDANDNTGFSVSSAGDVNGDGISDIIISAFNADPNGGNSGESYVVFGSTAPFGSSFNLSSLNGANGFKLNGDDAGDRSGRAVAGAGDVNGDGIDDLIIGAVYGDPNGQTDAGQTYVVFGSTGGFSASLELSALNGSDGFTINGISGGDRSGVWVSSAGDLNGDGLADVAIGAIRGDPNGQTDAGEIYVVFGSSTGFSSSLDLSALNGSNGFVLNGIDAGDSAGRSISSAGDINGDGIDDLLIGAYLASPNGGASGENYVVFGSTAGFSSSLDLSSLNGANGFLIEGPSAGDRSGQSVSAAGDINNDGIDDLLVTAYLGDPNDASNAGEAYVIYGSSAGFDASFELSSLNGANGFVLNGADAGDNLGFSAASAGDVNGDGIDDILVGAYGADPGETYVIFGRETLTPTTDTATVTITINGVNDAPVAQDDAVSVSEDDTLGGNVFVDNGSGIDSDIDLGNMFDVSEVNGSAANVGSQITLASGALLTVNANGAFSYDPNGQFDTLAGGTSDTDSFTYMIADGGGEFDMAQATITINGVNDAPTLSGVPSDVAVVEDTASNVDLSGVTFVDIDNDSLTITLTASGGTFSSVSGGSVTIGGSGTGTLTLAGTATNINNFIDTVSIIQYTGASNVNGDNAATVTVKVNDGTVNPQLGSFNIDITPTNDAPTLSGVPSDVAVVEDTASNIDLSGVTFVDIDNDSLTVTLTASGGTFSSVSGGSVTIGGSGTGTLTLAGTATNINNFIDTVSIIQYTGASNVNGDNAATVTVKVNDGTVNPQLGSFNIDITPANDDPVAQDDAVSVSEDGPALNGDVLADNGNGVDDDVEGDTLTVSKVNGAAIDVGSQITLASGALLTVNANGTFAYDPNGQFDTLVGGASDTDSFTYEISDGNGGVDIATATITINGSNTAPTAQDDAVSTDEGVTLNGDILADNGNGVDDDVEGDLLTVSKVNGQSGDVGSQIALASGALLTLNANGTFSYDTNGAFNSLAGGATDNDSFTYEISDGNGGVDTATATVTITGVGASILDDNIIGTAGADTLDGLAGNDTIDGLAGADSLLGGLGNDSILGQEGADTLRGGQGLDTLNSGGGNDRVFGDDGDDQLFTGFGDDRGEGGAGNDLIKTGPGKDTLLGGSGDDTLGASNRSDLLRGDAGNDLLLGSNGNDRLFGGDDNDTLLGGNGRDTLRGDAGADRLVGNGGDDTASYATAASGVDVKLWEAQGSQGSLGEAIGDVLIGIERLEGSGFNDTLEGDGGNNRLFGLDGDDQPDGMGGNDILLGGRGADTLTGGSGNDQFWYFNGDGADTITDFTAGAGTDDLIRLFGLGSAFDTFAEVIAASSDNGADTTIDFGGGNTILLQGVTVGDLHQDDFVFG